MNIIQKLTCHGMALICVPSHLIRILLKDLRLALDMKTEVHLGTRTVFRQFILGHAIWLTGT